jgi:hypothetical protein
MVTTPLEKTIENYLVKRVQSLGGECEKFTSPQRRSVPDRIVTMPGGKLVFVEVKRFGKQPTEMQARDHQRRLELGFVVWVVDSKAAVDHLVEELSC